MAEKKEKEVYWWSKVEGKMIRVIIVFICLLFPIVCRVESSFFGAFFSQELSPQIIVALGIATTTIAYIATYYMIYLIAKEEVRAFHEKKNHPGNLENKKERNNEESATQVFGN